MIARRSQPLTKERSDFYEKSVALIRKHGKDNRAEIDVSKISLRHDLPLVNWTVVIRFRDRPDEHFPVQARDPLSATRLIGYSNERSWTPEKLLAVESIHPRQG